MQPDVNDKRAERCAVCNHPANDFEGELISVVGCVRDSASPEPAEQCVHAGCRQFVFEPGH